MRLTEPEDYGSDVPLVELTRAELEGLLRRLDESPSLAVLIQQDAGVIVRAAENESGFLAIGRRT